MLDHCGYLKQPRLKLTPFVQLCESFSQCHSLTASRAKAEEDLQQVEAELQGHQAQIDELSKTVRLFLITDDELNGNRSTICARRRQKLRS